MEKNKIVYALPLLGILAGAAGTRLILKLGIASPLLELAVKLPLGSGIFSSDNLTLAGGLAGLVAAALIAGRMAGRQDPAKGNGKDDAQT